MSIFTKIGSALKKDFVSVESFVETLFKSEQQLWNNVEPELKADVEAVIRFGYLAQTYIANPSAAGAAGGTLISFAESVLGSVYTGLIQSVLGEVLVDLGIVDQAFTDPVAAEKALIDHLSGLKSGVGKEVLKIVAATAAKITGIANNNVITGIITFVVENIFGDTNPFEGLLKAVGTQAATITEDVQTASGSVVSSNSDTGVANTYTELNGLPAPTEPIADPAPIQTN